MEILARLWQVSWSHLASHVSYFSGIGTLLPVLGDALEKGVMPWVAHPVAFAIAALLILAGVFVLFWLERSIGKMFRVVGWMMLIPGMIALLFSFVTSDLFFSAARGALTGFVVVEPAVEWLVHHSVPASVNVGAAYVFFGLIFVWIGNKIGRIANIL